MKWNVGDGSNNEICAAMLNIFIIIIIIIIIMNHFIYVQMSVDRRIWTKTDTKLYTNWQREGCECMYVCVRERKNSKKNSLVSYCFVRQSGEEGWIQ